MNANSVRLRPRIGRALAAAVVMTSAGAVVQATSAHAATTVIHVSNRADDGSPSSLREAITAANVSAIDVIIELEPGAPYVIDRLCANGNPDDNHGGDLDITSPATIRFSAPPSTLASIVVQCAGERAVHHFGMGELTFERIRISGGNLPTAASGDQNGDRDGIDGLDGGAIWSAGHVRLTESVIENNRSGAGGNGAPALFAGIGGNGGRGGYGAAIFADKISSWDSIVTDNQGGDGGDGANGVGAKNRGGDGGDGGSGTLAAVVVTLVRTEVTVNSAGDGGDGGDGLGAGARGGKAGDGGRGGGVEATSLSLLMSTLATNFGGDGGDGGTGNGDVGGHGGDGGGGAGALALVATIATSTIHSNYAGLEGHGASGTVAGADGAPASGGGLLVVSGITSSIKFSTVTANRAKIASNIDAPAAMTIEASVVGEASGAGGSCANALTSLGFNVYDSQDCGVGPNDRSVSALGLGDLAGNGGVTRTRQPVVGGALIEVIPEDQCSAVNPLVGRDQRAMPRPYGPCEVGAVELPPLSATRYEPLAPARVFDTRDPADPAAGYVAAGETRTVQFAGVGGVPATGVTAVAFNLTVDSAGGPGFVSVQPTGWPPQTTSNLNTVAVGQIIPNFVVVPLGAGGQLDFFSQTGGHLLADIVGYFTPAIEATAGRIIPLRPTRVFDTREPGPVGGKLAAGGTITVPITGVAGVPATGVSAVVLNVTGTEADDAGYVAAWPGATPRPLASTLNLESSGHTAANMTILPVGADGTVSFYSQSGTHLLADVTGYVTDATAPASSEGLFVPTAPTRVFDTRDGAGALPPGGAISVATSGTATVPGYAAAVMLNVTATEAVDAGFVTGWPSGSPQPLASTLNLTRVGETRANGALLPVGHDGEISYATQSGTQLLADVFGYLLPSPVALTT